MKLLGQTVWKEFQYEFRVSYVGASHGVIADFLTFHWIGTSYFIFEKRPKIHVQENPKLNCTGLDRSVKIQFEPG